jgi:hypothetical protein
MTPLLNEHKSVEPLSESSEYRPLETKFTRAERTWWAVARQGDVALLAGTNQKSHQWLYEVVIVQQLPKHRFPNGNVSPAREAMPSNSQWGQKGWSLHGWDRAWQVFEDKAKELAPGLPRSVHPEMGLFSSREKLGAIGRLDSWEGAMLTLPGSQGLYPEASA